MVERTKNRIYFLDYLRGFMVLLVVLDHSMHAYSRRYADFWFFSDLERSTLIDILHLHNDAIMMPFLFFIAGMFVLPSLKRRGYLSFGRERLLRLGIPFVLGVFFVAPFMVYHKEVIRNGLESSFGAFWWTYYVRWEDTPFENLSQGGFWFLYFLSVLTFALVLIERFFPIVIRGIGLIVGWCARNPVKGFVFVALIIAIILGISDMVWGAPWWIGFKPVFHLRGSRFIVKILMFLLGVGVSQAGLINNQAFLGRMADSWKRWVSIAVFFLASYITWTLVFFDAGAYSDAVRYYFYQGGVWGPELGAILLREAPLVLVRTTLLGFVMLSLSVMYLSVFRYFLDRPIRGWLSLSFCSYGIYIVHEPFVTAIHLFFYGEPLPAFMKFLTTASISLGLSWLLVSKFLMRIPALRRIL